MSTYTLRYSHFHSARSSLQLMQPDGTSFACCAARPTPIRAVTNLVISWMSVRSVHIVGHKISPTQSFHPTWNWIFHTLRGFSIGAVRSRNTMLWMSARLRYHSMLTDFHLYTRTHTKNIRQAVSDGLDPIPVLCGVSCARFVAAIRGVWCILADALRSEHVRCLLNNKVVQRRFWICFVDVTYVLGSNFEVFMVSWRVILELNYSLNLIMT